MSFFFLILSGCGHTWFVYKGKDRGTIGYKGYLTASGATEGVYGSIPCPNYEIVGEGLTKQSTTSALPITTTSYSSGNVYGPSGSGTYSGTTQNTQYVPVTIDNSFRTIEYVCKKNEYPDLAQINNAWEMRCKQQPSTNPDMKTCEGRLQAALSKYCSWPDRYDNIKDYPEGVFVFIKWVHGKDQTRTIIGIPKGEYNRPVIGTDNAPEDWREKPRPDINAYYLEDEQCRYSFDLRNPSQVTAKKR